MKKILLLLLLLAPALLPAQDVPPDQRRGHNNILTMSPFHLIEGTWYFNYERLFLQQRLGVSLAAGYNYRPLKKTMVDSDIPRITPEQGYQGEVQLRYYFFQPQNVSMGGKGGCYFKGFYAGLSLMHRYRQREMPVYDYLGTTKIDDYQRITEWGAGAVTGVKIAFGNVVYMDFYLGLGRKYADGSFYWNTSYVSSSGAFTPGTEGWLPKGGFLIGIGF